MKRQVADFAEQSPELPNKTL